jgi:hypothetical protein
MVLPDISGAGADPTHHIVLWDGTTELGFVITDQGGDLDERTFRRFPFSDPTQPYVTEKQPSFGGGFGQHKFEDNRMAYWKSEGVDTTKDKLALGPQINYASGLFEQAHNFLQHSDDAFIWNQIYSGNTYFAGRFTTTQAWDDVTKLMFYARIDGTPPNNLRCSLYSASTGPGSELAFTVKTVASMAGKEEGAWVKVDLSYVTGLTTATNYWIVFSSTGGDVDNCWRVGCNNTQINGQKSSDGSAWSAASGDPFFRLEGDINTFIAKFYEYRGQLYFVTRMDNWTSSTLWMNGWRGACDSNSGDKTKLKDSTNTDWNARITGNEVARIVAGPASAERDDWRPVNPSLTGLANGTLPVLPTWRITHSATKDDYVVIGSDWFYQIAVPGTKDMKRVSDVAVSRGTVWFCRTGKRRAYAHREYNNAGVWTDDADNDCWTDEGDIWADFAQYIRYADGQEFVWFAVNAQDRNAYSPEIAKAEAKDWGDFSVNYKTLATIRPSKWTSGSGANVDVAEGDSPDKLLITVWQGKVYTVSVTSGGGGYSVGDDLKLIDTGSSSDGDVDAAQVNVDSVGGTGQVTAVSIINDGYDYTLGVKTTTGGAGANCTIEVTAVTGFTTGTLAYYNLLDDDDVAYTVDIRNVTNLVSYVKYNNYQTNHGQALASNELQLDLDNDLADASPFEQAVYPAKVAGTLVQDDITIDVSEIAGADSLASIGFSLAGSGKNKTWTLEVMYGIWGFNESLPVPIGVVDGDNITGLNTYGDPEQLWVFTESGMGEVSNNRWKPVPLRELRVANHPNNGRGSEVHDVYLMFTWRGRLQRYFRQNLEDLGPDFPAEMNDLQGDIVDIVTYPGRIYVAVDTGKNSTGNSMILCYKGGAWHEVYTSFPGERIRTLYIQAIPGKSDRLWAGVGNGVMWFPITMDAAEPAANTNYKYRPVGYLESSWIYTDKPELNKLYRSLIAVVNDATDADLEVKIYYKIDDEDNTWTQCPDETQLSASAWEYFFQTGTAGQSVRGNRIRIKVVLRTKDISKTPVVRSTNTRIYRLPEVRFSYSWISKVSSISINLRGDEERPLGTQTTISAALAKLDSWAETMVPLDVESNIVGINGKTVLLEPIPFQLLTIVSDEGIEEDVVQVSCNDL